MTISKAIPIKFWLNGQETFNELEVPGVDVFQFLQKFNNDDIVKLQITDTEIKSYRIEVLNSLDEVQSTTLFTRELIGGVQVYTITIDFSALTEGVYYLQLVSQEYVLTGSVSGLLGEVSAEITSSASVSAFDVQATIEGLIGEVSAVIEGELKWSLLSNTADNGRLRILINAVEKVNLVTTASLVDGTLNIADGDDIEIINTWISGAGNESRCRTCNEAGEIDYTVATSGDTTKTTSFTYATSDGVLQVRLRSGGLTPLICPT